MVSVLEVIREISVHTNEELTVLLAIGPKGCNFQRLRYKVPIVASIVRSFCNIDLANMDISNAEALAGTLADILSDTKNSTLWEHEGKHCKLTYLGLSVYDYLLSLMGRISGKSVPRFIDLLNRAEVGISKLQLLADWLVKAGSVKFIDAEEPVLVVDGKEVRLLGGGGSE
jgi:hypothetical protein